MYYCDIATRAVPRTHVFRAYSNSILPVSRKNCKTPNSDKNWNKPLSLTIIRYSTEMWRNGRHD